MKKKNVREKTKKQQTSEHCSGTYKTKQKPTYKTKYKDLQSETLNSQNKTSEWRFKTENNKKYDVIKFFLLATTK